MKRYTLELVYLNKEKVEFKVEIKIKADSYEAVNLYRKGIEKSHKIDGFELTVYIY